MLRDILKQAQAVPSGIREGTVWKGNTRVHWTVNKQTKEVLRTGTGLDAVGTMPEEARPQDTKTVFEVEYSTPTPPSP